MPLLDARGLCKSYGPARLLDAVDLTIGRGERLAVVGLNGCGKSTLARILAGSLAPDEGEVSRRRGLRVAVLEQVPVLDPARPARELALEGLSQWSAAKRRFDAASAEIQRLSGSGTSVSHEGAADAERLSEQVAEQSAAAAEVERLGGWERAHSAEALLGGLGLADLDRPAGEMSGGEARRVALARALIGAPDLVVLDEPTNHLDIDSIEWLERYLVDVFEGAVLLVTHDRAFLDRVAQRTLELDDGKLYSYDGGYEDYLEARARRLEQQARVEANRQRFVKQELEWLRRQPKARTGKQKARIKRAEAALDSTPTRRQGAVSLAVGETRSGKTILELFDLRVEIPERVLVDGLTFRLLPGQRVGVVGPNGCGKTTLLRTILGERAPDGGRVVLGKNTKPRYLSQTRDDLDESASVLENVAEDRDHVHVGSQVVSARAYLGRFLFPSDRHDQPVGALSGGERTRVALARLLAGATNLVVLDEPTNDLDVPTISALESMLVDYGGTALIVTHDRWFLDRVATQVLVFEGDGRVEPYAGNYTMMRVQQAERARLLAEEAAERAAHLGLVSGASVGDGGAGPAGEAAPSAGGKRGGKPKQKKAGLSYRERKELEHIEAEIEQTETLVGELEGRLAAPETYRDGSDIAALNRELEAAQARTEELMERWAELEERNA